jgi:hypothetical protein
MAWNQIRASIPERLRKRDPRWDERGLPYWQAKLMEFTAKMRAADSAAQLRRAVERHDEAAFAVWRLSENELSSRSN